MQRKHRVVKRSFIFINICLIYCGISETNLFTLYCCQYHITYSISRGFPMNLSFYDVFEREVNDTLEFYREISCQDYLLSYCKPKFCNKADKSISATMINFILKVWMYSSLHLQNRISFVVQKSTCIYSQLYFMDCTYYNHFSCCIKLRLSFCTIINLSLIESHKLMICQVFTIFLTQQERWFAFHARIIVCINSIITPGLVSTFI